MRLLVVSKKTGYQIPNPNDAIIIRDKRGILFYTTEPLLPRVKMFNLPDGEYFVERGKFEEMKNPVEYKLPKLPPYERHKLMPDNFQITVGKNESKCTIKWINKTIHFDDSILRDCTIPAAFFILYHEYGHAYYLTEKYADLYAASEMLKRGFNRSQIALGQLYSLSSRQLDRKNYIVNEIILNP